MYSKSSCRTFFMCYNNSSPGKRIFTTRNIMRKGNVFIRVCLFTGAGGSPCNHYLLSYWSVTGHMGIPPRPVPEDTPPPKKKHGSPLSPGPLSHTYMGNPSIQMVTHQDLLKLVYLGSPQTCSNLIPMQPIHLSASRRLKGFLVHNYFSYFPKIVHHAMYVLTKSG